MTEEEARNQIAAILKNLNSLDQEVICLAVNMARVPLPSFKAKLSQKGFRERESKWCNFLFETIKEIIRPDCTILTHTFSYSYASGNPFELETSKSETGPFSEHIRTRPEAVRSLHPVFSVSGVGPKAKLLLTNNGKAGFGPSSPFGRMSECGAVFVSLGTSVGESLTHLHHLEQLHGVNHRYNKIFDHPVWMAGRQLPGPWLCNLRYLSAQCEPELSNAEEALRRSGCLIEAGDAGAVHQSVLISDVDRICGRLIAENQCAFIERDITIEILEEIGDTDNFLLDKLQFTQLKSKHLESDKT